MVVGIGVRPRLTLAEQAGLKLDRGVAVDALPRNQRSRNFCRRRYCALARSAFEARTSGSSIGWWRERQGQTAARNMLGRTRGFDAVPFFWSQHYDVPINYVGHADAWDEIAVEGDIMARDCLLRYKSKGRVLAVASIYRDVANLQAELAMEQGREP